MEAQSLQPIKSFSSLMDQCKERIISQFLSIKEKNPQILNYILVLDEKTLQMISSYMKMNELVQLGIQQVEKLELKRKPFPKMAAIYFTTPAMQSIKKICEDFQNEQTIQYGLVHLLTTSKIDESEIELIGKTTSLAARLKTLKEINQDFQVIDDDIFDLCVPDALSILYSSQVMKNEKILKKQQIAQKIFTLLTTFEKFYEFEIVYNEDQNQISKDIALQLDYILDDYLKQLRNANNTQNLDKSAGKTTIVLIDRAFDTLTPVLHDFYYQSLIFDLMNVDNQMITMSEEKKVLLNYEDKVFQKYKYQHIAQLFEDLPDEFQLFLNKNQEFKNKNNKDMDINTMSKIIKGYNNFSEAKEKYSLHLELCSKMKNLYNEQQLAVIGDIEQTLATGVDQNGKEVKESKMMQQVIEQLKFLNPDQQFRLILSVFLALLTNDKDKLSLVQELKAKFPDKYLIITKIRQLGVVFGTETKYRFDKEVKKVFKNEAKSTSLLFCRYIPKLAQIFENLIMDIQTNSSIASSKLIQFKSLIINKQQQQNKVQLGGGGYEGGGGANGSNDSIPHSIRRKKLDRILQGPSESSSQQQSENNSFFQYQKLFVVILGGISYTELRSIMNQNKMINNNLMIKVGGTSILKPIDYINGIAGIKTEID